MGCGVPRAARNFGYVFFYSQNTTKMKKLIVVLCLIAGCKKTTNVPNAPTLTSEAAQCGLILEKVYFQSTGERIIFHSNQTITEFALSDSFTYPATFVYSTNNSKAILNNGVALKIHVVADSVKFMCSFYNNVYRFAVDTVLVGTFNSLPIVQSGSMQLGCSFAEGSNPIYCILTPL